MVVVAKEAGNAHTTKSGGGNDESVCVCVYKCANTLTQEKRVKGKKGAKTIFFIQKHK